MAAELKFTRDDKEVILILPENLNEIKLKAKLEFDQRLLDTVDYLANEFADDFNHTRYIYLMCKALSGFFKAQGQDVDVETFFLLDGSKLVDENGQLYPEVVATHKEMYEGSEELDDPNEIEANLTSIFNYILTLCRSYEFDKEQLDFSFEYKGERFTVFNKVRDAIYGVTYGKVTIGELVEAGDIQRQLSKVSKNAEKSSVILTEMLRTIAVVARKEGEKFPYENSDKFIDERSKHFIDIDFKTASDVFFYLITSYTTSQKERAVSIFSNHLKEIMTQVTSTYESSSKKISEYGSVPA